MRRYALAPVIVVALLWSGSALQPGHAQTGPVTFYVATNGNDAWSGSSPDAGAGTNGPFATANFLQGQNRFQYAPGDIKPWKRLTDVEVVLYSMWVSARLPIASVDEGQRLVTFDRRTSLRMTESSFDLIGAQYHVENAFEFLDAPGEWYLDRDLGIVYYLPMPGEDIGSADVIAPNLTRVVQIQGNGRADTWVEYVNFRNLTFSHNDWFFPPGSAMDSTQAVLFQHYGAVFGDTVRHARFEGLTVAHTGAHGLHFPFAADITITIWEREASLSARRPSTRNCREARGTKSRTVMSATVRRCFSTPPGLPSGKRRVAASSTIGSTTSVSPASR